MPLIALRPLLDHAAEHGYGVPAFNVNNMEQIQAIMEAARETSSPVIIQASRGARSYTNDRFLWHLMQAAVELYPEIPVALHPDATTTHDVVLRRIVSLDSMVIVASRPKYPDFFAHQSLGQTYANGSNQAMGLWNVFVTTTLKQTGPNFYVIGTCP